MRLDRALSTDLGTALRSGPVRFFLLLQVLAGAVFVWRRGGDAVSMVLLVWLGLLALAFFAWWAGRHRLAHPTPDPVPAAGARTVFALIGVVGMVIWGSGVSVAVGFVLFVGGIGGWLWSAWRVGGFAGLRDRLTRDPRPFVPLLLFIYGFGLRNRLPETARGMVLGGLLLCLSITVRSIDEMLCTALPMGTHWLWHCLNGLMLGWMIEVYRRDRLARAQTLA